MTQDMAAVPCSATTAVIPVCKSSGQLQAVARRMLEVGFMPCPYPTSKIRTTYLIIHITISRHHYRHLRLHCRIGQYDPCRPATTDYTYTPPCQALIMDCWTVFLRRCSSLVCQLHPFLLSHAYGLLVRFFLWESVILGRSEFHRLLR